MLQDAPTFEEVVNAYYQPLYRFALGLTRQPSDAADLTQTVFERFIEKSASLRDPTKVKTWLFTTLYRDFLQQKRRCNSFPELELDEAVSEKMVEFPRLDSVLDAHAAVDALQVLEEPFRSTLLLFYLEDHSYREIAEILGVPVGTVMSRLSRGKELLRAQLDASLPAVAVSPNARKRPA